VLSADCAGVIAGENAADGKNSIDWPIAEDAAETDAPNCVDASFASETIGVADVDKSRDAGN
jgi:hypothetical protein